MKRMFMLLVLGGCFPSSQPPPQNPQPTQQDMLVAGCEANVRTVVGTYCQSNRPDPLPSGWAESVRRGYESQRASCPAEVLAPLEKCVHELEAIASAQDPDAKQRREAARPKAQATKQDARFKKLIDSWLATFDQLKIICRHESATASHARECERAKTDLDGIEVELRTFLKTQGFDMRDVGELGLWPSDPDGIGG